MAKTKGATSTTEIPNGAEVVDELSQYLTLGEAGKEAGLAPATILGAIYRGRIPERWIGNMRVVHRDDLEAYLRTRRPRGGRERLRQQGARKRRRRPRRLTEVVGPEQRVADIWKPREHS